MVPRIPGCRRPGRQPRWLALVAALLAGCASPVPGTNPPDVADGARGEDGVTGVRRHTADALETTLVEVRRSGPDTLIVRWRYHNRSSQRRAIIKGARGWQEAFDASFLVHPMSGTKLLVLRDGQDRVVGGVEMGPVSLELGPGQSVALWAKFPAPPPEARTVTVQVPGAPPFAAVPIAP
jgi:hypothetical protein